MRIGDLQDGSRTGGRGGVGIGAGAGGGDGGVCVSVPAGAAAHRAGTRCRGTGHGWAIVVPVRRRPGGDADADTTIPATSTSTNADTAATTGSAAVLKIAYPHEEALLSPALALWGGHGAVRLLAADAGSGALLLERLDAGRSLLDVPLETAVTVWGGLVRQLSVVPDDRPEWREIDHVAARAEQWSDELPETWEQLGGRSPGGCSKRRLRSARPAAPSAGGPARTSWSTRTCTT